MRLADRGLRDQSAPSILSSPAGLSDTLNYASRSILQRRLKSALDRTLWYGNVHIPLVAWHIIEFFLTLTVSLLLMPALISLYLLAKSRGGGIRRTVRMGQHAKAFEELSFSFEPFDGRRGTTANPLLAKAQGLPALANVLRGEMSLVGPRTLSREDISFQDRCVWKRFGLRPGLIGLWWVRKQANIHYDREAIVDAEYADSKSVQTDLGILLRSFPAAFYGSTEKAVPRKIDLLGIPIDNVSMDEALSQIMARTEGLPGARICFVNADCVNIAQRDSDYATLLRESEMVLADGIGVKLASNLLQTPICQNVNGTDLVPRLCALLAKQDCGIYLLGGLPGVAEGVSTWMEKTYPGLRVEGCQHGYFAEQETPAVVARIRASGAKILLVAMGAPRQEKWIRDHAEVAGVAVSIGVGGLFDFYAGRIARAPVWVREIGMEWFFRLCQEPARMWKRYLVGNVVFTARVFRTRATSFFNRSTSPLGRH